MQAAEAEKKDVPMADADAAEATAEEAAPNGSAAPDSAGAAPMETDGSSGKPESAPQVGLHFLSAAPCLPRCLCQALQPCALQVSRFVAAYIAPVKLCSLGVLQTFELCSLGHCNFQAL